MQHKKNFLIAGILILVLLMAIEGTAILSKPKKVDQQVAEVPNDSQMDPTPGDPLFDTQPAGTNSDEISWIVDGYCIDNTIDLGRIPYSLSDEVITEYEVQETIKCYGGEERYTLISKIISTAMENTNTKEIYFFDERSKWLGMGDNLAPLDNSLSFTNDDKTYYFDIQAPGPYGVSDLGLWLNVIIEKTNPDNGNKVRVINNVVVRDERVIELIRKFGEKTQPNMEVEYTLNNPEGIAKFNEEFEPMIPTIPTLKEAMFTVKTDIDQITFK